VAQKRKDQGHYTVHSADLITCFQQKEIKANRCKEGLLGQTTRERASWSQETLAIKTHAESDRLAINLEWL